MWVTLVHVHENPRYAQRVSFFFVDYAIKWRGSTLDGRGIGTAGKLSLVDRMRLHKLFPRIVLFVSEINRVHENFIQLAHVCHRRLSNMYTFRILLNDSIELILWFVHYFISFKMLFYFNFYFYFHFTLVLLKCVLLFLNFFL